MEATIMWKEGTSDRPTRLRVIRSDGARYVFDVDRLDPDTGNNPSKPRPGWIWRARIRLIDGRARVVRGWISMAEQAAIESNHTRLVNRGRVDDIEVKP